MSDDESSLEGELGQETEVDDESGDEREEESNTPELQLRRVRARLDGPVPLVNETGIDTSGPAFALRNDESDKKYENVRKREWAVSSPHAQPTQPV